MPLKVNFKNFAERQKNIFLENIQKEKNLLENNEILKEFKHNDLGILKKAGLQFLTKNFQTYNNKKKIDSIILINIGYLSNSKKSGIQINDLDFIEFIFNLLSSEDLFKYGLISFHLLLNRYVKYERGIHGYNNFFFQELIKEIDETKRDFLIGIIIEGITNKREIEKNPDKFFEILDKHLSTDYKNLDKLTYSLFFDKIFKLNENSLNKYREPLLNLIESNISQIFQRDNVFTVFKHIYVNLYNKEDKVFQKMDDYLEKNIENIGFLSKLIDFINNFMPKNFGHSFYKNFYKKYYNLSYKLKDQRKFNELGLLWNGFNIYSLKDLDTGELIDKDFFKKIIDDFKIVLLSGESPLFNAKYMELEELLNLRSLIKPIMVSEKTKEYSTDITENSIKIEKIELSEDKLLQILINDMVTLQQKNRAIKEEEDKYTVILSEMLNRSLATFNYFTDVQDLSGKTDKIENKNPELGGMGELDLRFLNGNHELCHIGEALILDSIRTDYTKAHLKKIFDYDANGLPVNFMIIYSKVKDFELLWGKYSELVKEYEFEYPLIDKDFIDLTKNLSKYAGIKVGLTKHLRSGRICKLYHFFLDFS